MTYAIRYRTASHVGVHGFYPTLDDARRVYAADVNEWRWYRNRLAVIVAAADAAAAQEADAIETADEVRMWASQNGLIIGNDD